jgi:predicted metal-dependent hydrolase
MPETPQYTVKYREVKHPRCEFKTGALLIILPKKGWTPEQVLEKYQEWIKRKQATINTAVQATNGTTLVEKRTDKELRCLVQQYTEVAQKDLNTKINKIYYRKMTTKWASHSQNNNLTINSLLKFLPNDLINYIVYHEIAHNREKKHNLNFWAFVSIKYPTHDDKEKQLLTYWFLLQKKQSHQSSTNL